MLWPITVFKGIKPIYLFIFLLHIRCVREKEEDTFREHNFE